MWVNFNNFVMNWHYFGISTDFTLGLLLSNGVDILEASSTDIDEVQVQSVEKNVSLLCSSGLSDKFSSLHIPAAFFFYPKHDTDDYNVSSICDSNDTVSVNNRKWIITRQQSPPHDCVLTIVDFGGHDVGKYRCAGVLDTPSMPVEDWSNYLHLKFPAKLQSASAVNPSSLAELWVTVFFGVIVSATIAIFLALVALVVGYSAYRIYRSTNQPVFQGTCILASSPGSLPGTRLHVHVYIMVSIILCCNFHSSVLPRFQCYGSTSTVNDLSRPRKLSDKII